MVQVLWFVLANYNGVQGVHWFDPKIGLGSFARFPTLLVLGFDVHPCLEYYNVQPLKLSFLVNCSGN